MTGGCRREGNTLETGGGAVNPVMSHWPLRRSGVPSRLARRQAAPHLSIHSSSPTSSCGRTLAPCFKSVPLAISLLAHANSRPHPTTTLRLYSRPVIHPAAGDAHVPCASHGLSTRHPSDANLTLCACVAHHGRRSLTWAWLHVPTAAPSPPTASTHSSCLADCRAITPSVARTYLVCFCFPTIRASILHGMRFMS